MNGCGKPSSGTDFLDVIRNELPSRILPSYDRTIIYKLVLTASGSENNGDAILFDSYANDASGKVTLTMMGGLSTAFIRNEVATNPIQIVGLKFYVSNAINFFNIWTVQKQKSTGGLVSGKYNPADFYSPANNQSTVIEDWGFNLLVDGSVKITVPVTAPANTTQTEFIAFYVNSRANIAGIATGGELCESVNAPFPMGTITQKALIKTLNPKCRC